MSSNSGNTSPRKVPAGVFVLLLFGLVAVMFAVFYLPTKKIKENEPNKSEPVAQDTADVFIESMQSGKNLLDQGVSGAEKAAESFQKAVELNPGDLDAHLNLANALLLLGRAEGVMVQTAEALKLNSNSAAAHYLNGCAHVRLGQFEEAVQSLQIAKQIDQTINAVSYQLGRAHQGLGQWEQASLQFEEVVQFDPEHPSAYYNLSQTYIRMQRQEDAEKMMEKHQQVVANNPLSADPSITEKCIYTEAIAPFRLEQPDAEGLVVRFEDATNDLLGEQAGNLLGPVGVLDIEHDDQLDLLVREKDQGFKLLVQKEGVFQAAGFPVPLLPDANYTQCLIGDLQHQGSMRTGQQEDAILLSDKGAQVLQVSPNGMLSDSSMFSRLSPLHAVKGRLTDFDVTGKLDLIAIGSTNKSLLFHRNMGTFSFNLETTHTNLPTELSGVNDFVLEDWDGDDLADLLVTFENQASRLYLKQRGAPMKLAEASSGWPQARTLAVGDLNNDLRMDVVFLTAEGLQIRLQGDEKPVSIALDAAPSAVKLLDYDNDGWLDVSVYGGGVFRMWRNRGLEGFAESTTAIGLTELNLGDIQSISKGDFDGDCDSDLLVTLADQSIRILRNQGGNANTMMKIRMEGSRSNPSGLGVKVELTAGGLRLARTLHELPFEIGLGKRTKVDSIDPHWSDTITQVDYEIDSCSSLVLFELEMPTGSCPYLYAWDGERYRFVTDLLGAAPLGLPVAENVYIPADTDEWVWLGDEQRFPSKEGHHVLQLTEELREVLYLDEAKLAAVDHPAGTEVHTTGKLVPGPPFPQHELRTFGRARSVISATRNDGEDLTEALQAIDRHRASPVALQAPQLRGWAEPYAIDLDFGEIDGDQPWALVMTGWLHFGGGMANIGASHHSDLPFPFPTLKIQDVSGEWRPLEVTVGAPAGKTKTIVVDLAGKLPSGPLRLQLSMAFEIHWDRIQLMQAVGEANTHVHLMTPTETDLHWRGFSTYEERVWGKPLTPDYSKVDFAPSWLMTPSGWCTRYGDVSPLIDSKDNALALLNGGDELTLKFAANQIPQKETGLERDFYFFSSGWDKDADFHVAKGWTVGPMPWHGMDDQQYGRQPYPEDLNTEWMDAYNTRWVGEMTLRQKRNSRP
jgi:Flp pilus assembly protein TadD